MNDENKNPLWPLYLADALMFATVLLMAFPNIILKRPLSGGQMFALVFMVLAAMFLLILPYFLKRRSEPAAANEESDDAYKAKIEEQFSAVFADLRSLRTRTAQSADDLDSLQKSLASVSKESLSDARKLSAMEGEVAKLYNSISEIRKSAETDSESMGKKLECEETIARLEALETFARRIENELEEFKNSFEEIEEEDQDTDGVIEGDEEGEEAPLENTPATEPKSMEETACENFEGAQNGEYCDTVDLSDDGDEAPIPYGNVSLEEKPKQAKNWEGLIDKALSNSQTSSTRDVVSRFIEKNKAGEAPATENGMEADIEKKLCQEELPEDGSSALEDSDYESLEDIFEDEDSDESELEEDDEILAGDFEAAPENTEQQEEKPAQAALFAYEDTPQKEKPKRVKTGDTAVIVTAYPGIGNKLFIRGHGGGLSPHQGTPMHMVEIGKWQWKCEALLQDDIKITIWLNDERQYPVGELTVRPNETIEADISFNENA